VGEGVGVATRRGRAGEPTAPGNSLHFRLQGAFKHRVSRWVSGSGPVPARTWRSTPPYRLVNL